MHELGITQSIVEAVAGHAGGARVNRVTLEIGKLSAVIPEAIRFCFDVCAEGTVADGAELEIIEVPGRGRCRGCARELEMSDFLVCCACGCVDVQCTGGEELRIKSMEVI